MKNNEIRHSIISDLLKVKNCDVVALAKALESGNTDENKWWRCNLHGYRYSRIDRSDVKALANLLSSGLAPKQLTLNFDNNKAQDKILGVLIDVGCSLITSGIYESNWFVKNSCAFEVKDLANALRSGNAPENLTLKLSHNLLGYSPNGMKQLADAIRSGKTPKCLSLNLSYNHFDGSCVKKFANALKSGKAPRFLNLNFKSNSIGDQGLIALSDVIKSGNAPEGLNLNLKKNNISDVGIKAFAEAIKSGNAPSNLKVSLGLNNIEDGGIKDLMDALMSGSAPLNLTLDLQDAFVCQLITNSKRAYFIKQLEKGIIPEECYHKKHKYQKPIFPETWTSRKILDILLRKEIGNTRAKALAEVIKSGKAPQGLTLNLSGNAIGYTGAHALAEALKSGKAPENLTLQLSDNYFGAEILLMFDQAFKGEKAPKGVNVCIENIKYQCEDQRLDEIEKQLCDYNGIFLQALRDGDLDKAKKEINALDITIEQKKEVLSQAILVAALELHDTSLMLALEDDMLLTGGHENIADESWDEVEEQLLDYNSPFSQALRNGDLDKVEKEINTLDNTIEQKEKILCKALAVACEVGNLSLVSTLINKGARVNTKLIGEYPLLIACAKGYLAIVKYLIQKGADVNVQNTRDPGGSLLDLAKNDEMRVEIIQYLEEIKPHIDFDLRKKIIAFKIKSNCSIIAGQEVVKEAQTIENDSASESKVNEESSAEYSIKKEIANPKRVEEIGNVEKSNGVDAINGSTFLELKNVLSRLKDLSNSQNYDLVLISINQDQEINEINLRDISIANKGNPILINHAGRIFLHGYTGNSWGLTELNEETFKNFDFPEEGKTSILRHYLINHEMREEIETKNAHSMQLLNQSAIYVEPEVCSMQNNSYRVELKKIVNEFLKDPNKLSLLILGEAGSGKTLFCKRLVSQYWHNWQTNEKKIFNSSLLVPMYIYLPRALKEKNNGESHSTFGQKDLLESYLREMKLSYEEIEILRRNCYEGRCRLLIILDGFDEIDKPEKSFYETNQWVKRWGSPKLVTASRPEAFGVNEDYQKFFRPSEAYDPKVLQEIYLQPFSEKQIQSYVNAVKIKNKDCTELNYLYRIEPLVTLSKNPLILSIMVKVLPKIGYKMNLSNERPEDTKIKENNVYIYLENDSIKIKSKKGDGNFREYIIDKDTNITNEQIENIKTALREPLRSQLSQKDKEALLKVTSCLNYPPSLKDIGNDTTCIPFTKYQIYKEFVEDWLGQQAKRILADPKKSERILKQYRVTKNDFEYNFKYCLRNYLKNIARLAWNKGKGKLNVLLSEEETLNPDLLSVKQGKELFFQHSHSKEEMKYFLRLLRSASLLKCEGNTYQFFHKSILEYLCAKQMFKGVQIAVDYYLKGLKSEKIKADFALNDKLLTSEPNTLKFLADIVCTNSEFKGNLYDVIELSKKEDSVRIAAANAITILKASGEIFNNLNWSNINIAGADLSEAICEGTNFSGANLENVNFENAWLKNANFSKANLRHMYLNAPCIKNNCEITAMSMDPMGSWLLTGDKEGYLTQWDLASGKPIHKWRVNKADQDSLAKYKTNRAYNDAHPPSIGRGPQGTEMYHYSNQKPTFIPWVKSKLFKVHPSIENISLSENGLLARIEIQNDEPEIWDLVNQVQLNQDGNRLKEIKFCENNKNDIMFAGDDGEQVAGNRVYSRDGRLAAYVSENKLQISDTASQQCLFNINTSWHSKIVPPLFSSRNNTLYYVNGNSIHNWKPKIHNRLNRSVYQVYLDYVSKGKPNLKLNFNDAKNPEITPLDFSRQLESKLKERIKPQKTSGYLIGSKEDDLYWIIKIKNSLDSSNIKKIKFPQNISALNFHRALSPNKRYLLVGCNNKGSVLKDDNSDFHVVDLDERKAFEFSDHNLVNYTQFSDDSKWLFTVSDNNIFIWDVKLGRYIDTYSHKTPLNDYINAIALSSDKKYLGIASKSGLLSIWNTKHHSCVYKGSVPLSGSNILTSMVFAKNNDANYLEIHAKSDKWLYKFDVHKNNSGSLNLIDRTCSLNINCQGSKLDGAVGLSKKNKFFLNSKGAIGSPLKSLTHAQTQDEFKSINQKTYSIFKQKIQINPERWTVSLVRDPLSIENKQHTFIVVEGMNQFGLLIFFRFELATKIGEKNVEPNGFGKVVSYTTLNPVSIKKHRETLESLIIPHQEDRRRNILNLLGKTWSITREKALELIDAINKDNKPIPFSSIGDTAFGYHNCFTWAREKLLNLNIEEINQKLKIMPWEIFINKPSWRLSVTPDHDEQKTHSNKKYSFQN